MGIVEQDPGKSDLHIKGTISDVVDQGRIRFIAAAPADYHSSYTGSALPFATPMQAFQNTPNKGEIMLQANQFSIRLLHPNSFYEALGSFLIPPTLFLHYFSGGEEKTINVKVAEEIPYRRLTYPVSRDDPLFYNGTDKLPIRTQERILRDSPYPARNHESHNIWGLKPRC